VHISVLQFLRLAYALRRKPLARPETLLSPTGQVREPLAVQNNCVSSLKKEIANALHGDGRGRLPRLQHGQAFLKCCGLETVSLRYSNIFGPRQDPSSPYTGVLAKFCTAFLEHSQPVVFGDGRQTRDFTFVDNAVHANLLTCEAPNLAGKVFNIGCGGRVSLNEVLATLRKITGKALEAKYDAPRKGDIRESHLQAAAKEAASFFRTQLAFAKEGD